jgi:hypothetical protein
LVYDEQMLKHCPPDGFHPERPERLSASWDALKEYGLVDRCIRLSVSS